MPDRLPRRRLILIAVFVAGLVVLLVRWGTERGEGSTVTLAPSDLTSYTSEATPGDDGISITADGAAAFANDVAAKEKAAESSLWHVDVASAFAGTNDFALSVGSYSVTVDYEASGADGSCDFYNGWASDVVGDDAVLSTANTSCTFEATASKDQSSAKIYFYSNGGAMTVHDVTITPTNGWADGRLLEGIVLWCAICYAAGLVSHALRRPTLDLGGRRALVILAATTLFACLPLCVDTILVSQDMSFHLMRIEGIYHGLLAGQFPVRVYPNLSNGNGYASGIMYGDVLLYFPALLRICGLSLQMAYKAFVVAMTAFTCLICYWCLKRMFGSRRIATFGSAVFLLAPYRLTDVFVRAAVGEYCALAFMPLVIYGFWHILTADTEKRSYRWAFMPLALGLSGLVLTHVLSLGMVGLFLVIAALVFFRRAFRWPRLREYLKAIGLSVLWCLWFLVPFMTYLLEGVCGVGENASAFDLHDSASFVAQIAAVVSPVTGISQSLAAGTSGEMPLGVGIVLLVLAATFVLVAVDVDLVRANRRLAAVGATCCSLGLAALWLSSDLFPWDLVADIQPLSQLLGALQFSWRFLAPAAALLLMGGMAALALLWRSKPAWAHGLVVGLATIAVISAGFTYNSLIQDKTYESVLSGATLNTAYDNIMWGEYLPAGTAWGVTWGHTEPSYDEGLVATSYDRTDAATTLSISNGTDSDKDVTLPLLAYPGYVATDTGTGQGLAVSRGTDNELAVTIPAGWSGTFTVRFEGLWFWHVTDVVSGVGIALTILAMVRARRRRKDASTGVGMHRTTC